MKNKTIVITGARDSIGAAALRRSANGHLAAFVGRSPHKAEAVAREVVTGFQQDDFAKLNEVRRLVDQLMKHYPCIDLPTNNVGSMFDEKRRASEDGHGQTFQVSYLAPILEAVGSHGQRHPFQLPSFPTK